jgi:hypothetical protein
VTIISLAFKDDIFVRMRSETDPLIGLEKNVLKVTLIDKNGLAAPTKSYAFGEIRKVIITRSTANNPHIKVKKFVPAESA